MKADYRTYDGQVHKGYTWADWAPVFDSEFFEWLDDETGITPNEFWVEFSTDEQYDLWRDYIEALKNGWPFSPEDAS